MQDTAKVNYGGKSYDVSGVENDHIYSIIKLRSSFYELDLLEAVNNLKLEGTYVDVGSNIGNHSLFFSTCCSAKFLISIEPLDIAFKYLVQNVSGQNTIPVEFFNCAISDASGFGSMTVVDPNNIGMSKIESGNTISIRTLDSILQHIDDVSFIKIDVEGFEAKVLKGASNILEKFHPVLAIESATESEFQEVKDILEPLGYLATGKYGLTPVWLWQYLKEEPIPRIAIMSTLYNRIDTAKKTISSISSQVDKVCIVLNRLGNEDIEEWKKNFIEENIEFFVRDNQLGDAERYLPIDDSKAYYLSIDDDLVYPSEYVNMMVSGCRRYNTPVSLHGKYFTSFPIASYYRQENARYPHCRRELPNDLQIHVPGTGVMCWRSDQINLKYENFLHKNQADVEVSRIAVENNVKIMCLAHKPLEYMPPAGETIYDQSLKSEKDLVDQINSIFVKSASK